MSRYRSFADKIVRMLKGLGQSVREVANHHGGYVKPMITWEEANVKWKEVGLDQPFYTMRAYEMILHNWKADRRGWLASRLRRTGEDHKL